MILPPPPHTFLIYGSSHIEIQILLKNVRKNMKYMKIRNNVKTTLNLTRQKQRL